MMKPTIIVLAFLCVADGQLLSPPSLPRFGGLSANAGLSNIQGAVSGVVKAGQSLLQQFTDFKEKFNKQYSSLTEELHRKEIFIETLSKINLFNEDYAKGVRGFATKINPFADMTFHEFFNQFNGFNRSSSAAAHPSKGTTFVPPANVIFPETVDWREAGAVGPVEYQGKCAGCWAFAAAGALEAHHYRKTGQLPDVSVQNLIDCTEPYGNSGCNGGLMTPAYEYVRDNEGVDSEKSYPFEEKVRECRFKRENSVVTCTEGYVEIPVGDEKALEIAVGTVGPVSVGIDAGRPTFQFYSDGIYDESTCSNGPDEVNHAVLVVGYGRESDGREYWIIKNSYGPQWGIGGYMKLAKNAGNRCGIASKASYPLV